MGISHPIPSVIFLLKIAQNPGFVKHRKVLSDLRGCQPHGLAQGAGGNTHYSSLLQLGGESSKLNGVLMRHGKGNRSKSPSPLRKKLSPMPSDRIVAMELVEQTEMQDICGDHTVGVGYSLGKKQS